MILFVLGTSNVYSSSKCDYLTAFYAIQDYYHDNIDSSRQDEYTDPAFALIQREGSEKSDDGVSYLFKEEMTKIEEGEEYCTNLYIRFNCHPKVPTIKHEYVPCDKI